MSVSYKFLYDIRNVFVDICLFSFGDHDEVSLMFDYEQRRCYLLNNTDSAMYITLSYNDGHDQVALLEARKYFFVDRKNINDYGKIEVVDDITLTSSENTYMFDYCHKCVSIQPHSNDSNGNKIMATVDSITNVLVDDINAKILPDI